MARSATPLVGDLVSLAELLDETVPPGAPVVVAVRRDGTGPSRAPATVDQLEGWSAPAEVDALGIVCSATVRPLDGAGAPAGGRLVLVLDRRGQIAARLHTGSGVVDEVPSGGAVLDCLRRCLGLATPAPEVGPVALLDLMWLLDLATSPDSRLGWRAAVRRHPLAGCAASDGSSLPPLLTAAEHPGLSWERLRLAAAAGDLLELPLEPAVAAWMDEGIFSRSVMDRFPPLDVALRLAGRNLTAAALSRAETLACSRAR